MKFNGADEFICFRGRKRLRDRYYVVPVNETIKCDLKLGQLLEAGGFD